MRKVWSLAGALALAAVVAGTAAAAPPQGRQKARNWITTHNGHPDYLMTASNASTGDPDKQWITIDDNPSSPHYGRIYAMWTVFVLNPSRVYVSYADARPDGTHTDWSAPHELPTIQGHPWDTYMIPHV